jgi:hypothetical protein
MTHRIEILGAATSVWWPWSKEEFDTPQRAQAEADRVANVMGRQTRIVPVEPPVEAVSHAERWI